MIRGFMKTTSRTALLAAAGLLMGSYAYGPVKAADLGGSCCGDLEERVAELEATTARKGNRVVSLQVYGQVNKALLYFDDGAFSDVYVVDNDNSGSRIGFTGKATMKPGWTAGYLLEFDFQDAASDVVDNDTGLGDDPADQILIRYNNFYVENERLGRVTLGQGSTAADGANEVVLANSLRNGGVDHGTSFSFRTDAGALSAFSLGNIASDLDTSRDDLIRYDSPSFYGFILSASWGDNDYADVALRFKKEWNSVRIAAGLAWVWDGSEDGAAATTTGLLQDFFSDFEQVGGSISLMHIPTGLYIHAATAQREYDDPVAALSDEMSFWYVQAGIEKKWLPYGATTVYGEYGIYEDMLVDGSEAERWGLGLVQKFDSAAMEVYAQATFWAFDGAVTGTTAVPVAFDAEDITTVMVGSRLKF
jgi:hypothetical protein